MRFIPACCAISVIAGSALAADLSPTAPVAVAPQAENPAYDWNGIYFGANIGYGWNHAALTDSFSAPGVGVLGQTTTTTENLNGLVGGGQVGYNWQRNHLVLGAEADFDLSGQVFNKASGCDVGGILIPGCTIHPLDSIQWVSTLRGRAGWAVDRWLLYVTGGLAWQNLQSEGSVSIPGAGQWEVFSTSTPRTGYVVGGGAEAALAGGWSVGIEYLFIDTGTHPTANTALPGSLDATLGGPAGTSIYETHHLTDQLLRLRVNFRL